MVHSHVNQYQIRAARADGTEELTLWMDSETQLAQAMATLYPVEGTTYWLRVRSDLCPDCSDRQRQTISESPITGMSSPRYRPHNSDYLLALGSKSRYELFHAVVGSRR